MFRINVVGRTVEVYELKVENKTGLDGKPYESKSITFKVASNRNYTVNKMVNGVAQKERPTDFMFCKATGSLAQAIADHANERKADGKLVSRHLELHGHLETYSSTKKTVIEEMVPIGEKKYKIKFNAEVPVDQTIFIVKEIDFLDSNPSKAKAGATVVGGESGMQISECTDEVETIEINQSSTTASVQTPAQTQAPAQQTVTTQQATTTQTDEAVVATGDTIPAPVLETPVGGNCPF